jgi:hypothetical protein
MEDGRALSVDPLTGEIECDADGRPVVYMEDFYVYSREIPGTDLLGCPVSKLIKWDADHGPTSTSRPARAESR